MEYAESSDVVLDGLYSWDELVILKEKLGDKLNVIAIIADRKLRYSRLNIREIRPLTNEEAEARDIAEIENLAKGGPIAMADYFLLNNLGIDEYINNLENILSNIE